MGLFTRKPTKSHPNEQHVANFTTAEVLRALCDTYPDRVFNQHGVTKWPYVWIELVPIANDEAVWIMTGAK